MIIPSPGMLEAEFAKKINKVNSGKRELSSATGLEKTWDYCIEKKWGEREHTNMQSVLLCSVVLEV